MAGPQNIKQNCRSASQSCPTLRPHDCSPPDSCPWDSTGKDTGVGCGFLLQRIFPTQGSNPCLLHWQADSLLLSYRGSPKTELQLAIPSIDSKELKARSEVYWTAMFIAELFTVVNKWKQCRCPPADDG